MCLEQMGPAAAGELFVAAAVALTGEPGRFRQVAEAALQNESGPLFAPVTGSRHWQQVGLPSPAMAVEEISSVKV
jgi:hypothetical protein